jgi:hypothetical protein
MQKHIEHDSPEPSSSLHKHETTSSSIPVGQLSPVVLITTPTTPQTLEFGTQSPTEAADPGSQDFTPSQTSPSPSDPALTFPIMKLPPELRLMVFDQLFLDLTVRRQQSMKYRNGEKLLQKHQVNDFRPYTNLLLTCKELNTEAKKFWEEQYLRECCFYFWHVSKLYDLALVLQKLGGVYTELKYVLRSQWEEDHVSRFCLTSSVRHIVRSEAENLMSCQPGVLPDFPDEFEEQFKKRIHRSAGRYSILVEGIYEATEENPIRAVIHKDQARKCFTRGEYPSSESCTISTHQDNTPAGDWYYRSDTYSQMQGKFSGIFWGGYDAVVSYGIFKLWEGAPLCPGPGHCPCEKWDNPENRFDCLKLVKEDQREGFALLHRWYNEIVEDPKWLGMGGQSDHSELIVATGHVPEFWWDMDYWLECAREYWASWDFDGDEDTEGEGTQDEDTQDEGFEDEENEGETQRDGGGDGGGEEREDGEEPLEWYSPSR